MDVEYLKKVGLEVARSNATHVMTRGAVSDAGTASPVANAAATASAPRQVPSPKAQRNENFGRDLLGKGFEPEAVTRNSHPPWLVPSSGVDRKLQVVNSLTGSKESFRPQNGNKVLWYTCGPTVYDVAHMGHARTYLTFDIIRRIMTDYLGYELQYQINITDIDDKIILKSRQNKLFEDFKAEAAKMTAAEFETTVNDALKFAGDKLEKKTPVAPAADASGKDKQEFETLKAEHALKMQQHADIVKGAKAAMSGGDKSGALAAASDAFKGKLDKERGHTISDHSIFDAHARKFEDEYFTDMSLLGILRPDVVTRITAYMDGRVQKFIERLEELGVAYGSAGSVYFDIDAFEKMGYHYRKLVPAMCASAKEMEEGEGALAAEDAEKRNPNDFALWKKSKPGEPAWESKWGPGRPGWHIECSVMATDINGEYLDIHAGGEDLKFPHHDNEMAQSEAYLQRSQWVNYFWHAGHLHIEGLKMSKSLKNFITIRQALEFHSARQIRLMFLGQAWDKGMNYSDQAVDMAKAEERKFKHFLGSLPFWKRRTTGQKPTEQELVAIAELAASVDACKEAVHAAILDNFTLPKVLEALSRLTSECKAALDKAALDALPQASLVPVEQAADLVANTLSMLGVCGLRVTPKTGCVEAWTAALDAFASLRQDARDLARKKAGPEEFVAAVAQASPAVASAESAGLAEAAAAMRSFQDDLRDLANRSAAPAEVLKRCDVTRNADFVRLGARLEDRDTVGACPFLWMFDDREAMEAEQREMEEKAQEAAKEKLRNKLDQQTKALKVAEKASVEPKQLYKSGTSAAAYSEWDEEGIPVKLANGDEVSAKKRKDFVKEVAKQQKDHEKLLKQSGDAGIAAYVARLRADAEHLQKQIDA